MAKGIDYSFLEINHAVGDEYPVVELFVKTGIGKLLLEKYNVIEVYNENERIYYIYTLKDITFINMANSICLGATANVYKESRSIFYGEK